MSKLPAIQFYPGDWLRDFGVQSLPYHDQGVWMKLLCYMHESYQRGKLILNGRAMTQPEMCRLLGLEPAVLEDTVHNLLDAGVASMDEETGALMSRRMVRDEEGRQQRKIWGREGGRSAAAADPGHERPGFLFLVKRESDGKMRVGTSVNPTNRLYKLRFENRGENLILLSKRSVSNMRTALAEFTRRHLLKAHEWFAVALEKASSFLSSFLSSAEEDDPFLPPPSVSFSASELTTERENAGATPTSPPDEELHPLVAQIILAHPKARWRNWTVRDIPGDAVEAVLTAIRAEAVDGQVQPDVAGRRVLLMVQGIARGVPEEDWRFLRDLVPFFTGRDYRLRPDLLVHRKPVAAASPGISLQATVGMYTGAPTTMQEDKAAAFAYWELVQRNRPESFARDAPQWVKDELALVRAG